jgi:hypothetical protein
MAMRDEPPRTAEDICRRLELENWQFVSEADGYRYYVRVVDVRIVQVDMRRQLIPVEVLRAVYVRVDWTWPWPKLVE